MTTSQRSPGHSRGTVAGRTLQRALALLLALLLAAACQSGAQPAAIAYGEQRCDQCGEVIADRRFAAQFRAGDGAGRAFDDPGCLFAALRGTAAAEAVFFHDHDADRWISADDVYLVHLVGAASPRGYGWAAVADFTAAQDAVTGGRASEVLRFAEAREKLP